MELGPQFGKDSNPNYSISLTRRVKHVLILGYWLVGWSDF